MGAQGSALAGRPGRGLAAAARRPRGSPGFPRPAGKRTAEASCCPNPGPRRVRPRGFLARRHCAPDKRPATVRRRSPNRRLAEAVAGRVEALGTSVPSPRTPPLPSGTSVKDEMPCTCHSPPLLPCPGRRDGVRAEPTEKARIVKEMIFLQAKDGFSTSCQLLQFLQRASLGKTLNPATESSSSSLKLHIAMEFPIYRFSVVLCGATSWLWVKRHLEAETEEEGGQKEKCSDEKRHGEKAQEEYPLEKTVLYWPDTLLPMYSYGGGRGKIHP
ncbi:uncharacterized protein LOC120621184 [Pteropus medius]|uniref:uncharacterized protein LOC120621184 n=1 Tax=Pteropus vampyrus TaxID=132908 RepID=UPI00196A97BD|nr:uncharacterized protein LOC120621184 [Pteropus giganteus]